MSCFSIGALQFHNFYKCYWLLNSLLFSIVKFIIFLMVSLLVSCFGQVKCRPWEYALFAVGGNRFFRKALLCGCSGVGYILCGGLYLQLGKNEYLLNLFGFKVIQYILKWFIFLAKLSPSALLKLWLWMAFMVTALFTCRFVSLYYLL